MQPRSRQQYSPRSILLVLMIGIAAVPAARLAADEPIIWKTSVDFRRQLDQRIGFRWESNPIRPALRSLSRNQRVAIWLDRRVDPGNPLDLSVEDLSLDIALSQVAASVDCDVSYLDAVAYIGPPNLTSKLATVAAIKRDAVKGLPSSVRSRFEQRRALKWEDLSTPKELLQQLATEGGFEISNVERLPHDLWRAGDLPELPLTDRITLLLAGFDLTFELARDGSAIRPAPMPTTVTLQRTYTPRGSLQAATTKLAETFPSAKVSQVGSKLKVLGSFEDHELIARFLRGEPIRKRQAPVGEKGYDLRATNEPVGAIIKLIAEREKLDVTVDPAINNALQQRISLTVKQVSLEELLKQTLTPAGITYRLRNGVLELRPADP